MNKQFNEQIRYWKITAERNWETTRSLFKLKHYDACLFFCHLAIEKILKGLVVKKTKQASPYTHDLERLALLANLVVSKNQLENLKIISEFNIVGRYDNIKYEFYKKCTKEYTEKYFKICEELYLWLKKQYQKK